MSHGSTRRDSDLQAAPTSRLDTLPTWPDEGHAPLTLGWQAAEWAERNLIQPNGPRAGRPFRFTPRQLTFVLWWYALDVDGHWLFDHGARRLAKGSGKSPFAAVLALVDFCGPVRLDRKDSRLPGGVRGKPVEMPWVQIAATAESQTANTMRMVRAFAPRGSRVVERYNLDPGKTRYYRQPEGTLEVITSSVTASEGAESSFVVADETEHWIQSNSGPELAATLQDNLTKSGSRMLETSNAWVPGIGSVAEATWDAWVMQEEGKLRDGARILYDAVIAPPDTDLTNPDSLRAALRFVYGDCTWKARDADGKIDVKPIMDRIWSPRSTPAESRRKYLNQPAVHDAAWVTPASWAALADRSRVIDPAEPVVLFFDGSKSRDATAVVGCCVDDGYVFVPSWHDRPTVWEPDPAHTTADVVPVEEVDLAIGHIMDTLNIVAFFADVAEWESFTKIEWPKRFGDKLKLWAVPGGKDPQRIAWDMRSHVMDFTRAAELAEAEIVDAMFAHDDNPILARHVANCRRAPNRYGVNVSKESRSSALKIDAAVCMIGARMVRRLHVAAAPVQRTGRAAFL